MHKYEESINIVKYWRRPIFLQNAFRWLYLKYFYLWFSMQDFSQCGIETFTKVKDFRYFLHHRLPVWEVTTNKGSNQDT